MTYEMVVWQLETLTLCERKLMKLEEGYRLSRKNKEEKKREFFRNQWLKNPELVKLKHFITMP